MEDGEAAGVLGVRQIGVEARQLVGGSKALVDERAERARGHVGADRRPLDSLAHPQRRTLVGLLARGGLEGDVDDLRHRPAGEVAELIDVDGYLPPVDDLKALVGGGSLDCSSRVVAAHEQDSHAHVGVVAMAGDRCEQPGTVGSSGVGRDGPAVLHAGEPLERGRDDGAARAALGVGDEPDAAGIPLRRGRPSRKVWHCRGPPAR